MAIGDLSSLALNVKKLSGSKNREPQRIEDKNALLKGLVWVTLTYEDNSQFCFQTTLNTNILRDYGVVLEEGKLVRLDKQYYWNGQMIYRQFPFVGAVISMWTGLHYDHELSRALHDFF